MGVVGRIAVVNARRPVAFGFAVGNLRSLTARKNGVVSQNTNYVIIARYGIKAGPVDFRVKIYRRLIAQPLEDLEFPALRKHVHVKQIKAVRYHMVFPPPGLPASLSER